jgi:hypothetical protein
LAGLQKGSGASLTKESQDAAQALDKELADLQEGTPDVPGFGGVNRDVARFVAMIQSGDMRPARSIIENATPSCLALKNDLMRWRQINTDKLPAINQLLGSLGKLPITNTIDREPTCPN